MAKTLLSFLTKVILFLGLLFAGAGEAIAQSVGDIAFIGIHSGTQTFNIVALSNIPSHQTIYFADAQWSSNGFLAQEGTLSWETGNESIPEGNVISFKNINSDSASVSHGRLSGQGINLSALQYLLFVYQGRDVESPETFLTALATKASRERRSLQGTDLTEDEVLFLEEQMLEAQYAGPRQGRSPTEYLQAIGNINNNWESLAGREANRLLNQDPFSLASSDEQSGAYVTIIDGEQGWRALSSPAGEMSFTDWLGDFWTQGMIGADDPQGGATILAWNEEEGGYLYHPSDMREFTEPGKGYFVYFMEDDNLTQNGIQGGFPKTINSAVELDQEVVDVPVTATDADNSGAIDGSEGFNLLGNPFNRQLSVEAIKRSLRQISDDMNAHLYQWDPEWGNGNGRIAPLGDKEVIGPYETFWVRYMKSGVNGMVRVDPERLANREGQAFYNAMSEPEGSFTLKLGDDEQFDAFGLELNEEGEIGEDQLDGYKLFSLNRESINLFSSIGTGNRLLLNVLPNRLDERLQIPLSFSAPNRTELSFSWERPSDIPDHWQLLLNDNAMNREINMRTVNTYSFKQRQPEPKFDMSPEAQKKVLLNTEENAEINENRFSLVIEPEQDRLGQVNEGAPASISLKANYPNPFTSATTIPFELVEEAEVKLTIWNMIGQKVATLVDAVRGPEDNNVAHWNATNMPSGMYIARLEVGGEVFTRKMTLIK